MQASYPTKHFLQWIVSDFIQLNSSLSKVISSALQCIHSIYQSCRIM